MPDTAANATRLGAELRATRNMSMEKYHSHTIKGDPRWCLAAALGSAAATTMAAFFVSAATEAGLSEGLAGNLLAVASGLSIVNRIVAGYLADRFEFGHLRVVSLLLGTSTLGYLATASGSPILFPVGAIFALGLGWAWTGLIVLIRNSCCLERLFRFLAGISGPDQFTSGAPRKGSLWGTSAWCR